VNAAVWTPLSAPPLLAEDEAHIWRASLPRLAPAFERFVESLSPEERDRAARFRKESDRRRYVATHGALRSLLAEYLDIDPRLLTLESAPNGKPALKQPRRDIRFNISHSNDLALLAFTIGREVGIDVEEIRPIPDRDAVARLFFSEGELRALTSLEPAAQTEAFFLCWTRKEAYLKAKGLGLSQNLRDFEVSLVPDQPACLLACNADPAELNRWRLESLRPAANFAAAVAAERQDWRMQLFEWQPARLL